MTYLPKHQHQLGRGTPVPGATQGSRDCGVRAVQMGVDERTRGEKVPTVPAIRQRMGEQGPQTTSILDAQKAVESYRRIKGRKPLRYLVRWTVEGVKEAIGRGRMVQLAIDYGMFDRLMLRTGDPAFDGGHSVDVLGVRERHGETWWLLWDPLDDARRAGIPQGPRWVPARKLIAALEAFAGGAGRAQAGIFQGGQERERR